MGIITDLSISSNSIANIIDDNINIDSLTVGWWKFNNSLEETYQGNDFEPETLEEDQYVTFSKFNLLRNQYEDDQGLLFEKDKHYLCETGSIKQNSVYSMNLGFWYFSPKVLGFTKHVINKKSTPLTAPILAKCNTHYSSGQEHVTTGQGEWSICEIAYSETQNAIQLALCNNGNGPTVFIISEPYEPGLRHIYINIRTDDTNTRSYVRIDIDGGYGVQHIRVDGSILLQNTISPLRINSVNHGYLAHHTTQEGAYISDLIIQKKSSIYATKTILMNRFGPEIAITSDEEFPGFSFFGIGIEQPTTITTNQITSDGSSILLARSNGDLLRGYRPIWDNDFNYEKPSDLNNLNTRDITKIEWTPTGVRVKGSTIKI